jgi:hypothetical protein
MKTNIIIYYNRNKLYPGFSPRVLRKQRELIRNRIYPALGNEVIISCAGRLNNFSTTARSFVPNSDNNSQSGNENSGANTENSPSIVDEGSGYETDSNRSYFEDGTTAMINHPVGDIPEDQLRRYIKDTKEIVDYPEQIVRPNEDGAREIIQGYSDRHDELQEELDRRQREGLTNNLPDSPDPESSTNNKESAPSVNKDLESSTKRKFNDDSDSSIQPPKKFKQDSSDITGETEPFDFGGGDD